MNLLSQIASLGDTSGHSIRQFNSKTKSWWYKPVDAPITDEVIKHHLKRDEDCIGLWMNKEGGDKSHFCVFDLDDHDKAMSLEDVLADAYHIGAALAENGVPASGFISGSGHGAHIWVVFENAKRVDAIHKWADKVLTHASKQSGNSYTRKAGGALASGEVEVLPKGAGKQVIALPYGRASKLLTDVDGKLVPQDDTDFEVEAYKGGTPGPKGGSSANGVDRDQAFDCFIKKYDADNRSEWGAAAICLQAAFGAGDAWAKDRWVAWSQTSPEYKQGDDSEWDKMSGAKKYTPLSFWRTAKEHGYDGEWPFNKSEQRKLLTLDFLTDVRLLRDQSDVAYAELKERDFVRIDTNEFKQICALGMYRETQQLPAEQDVKSAQMIAQAMARELEVEQVALRYAKAGGKRYVYLGDNDRNVVEIDADGWRINNDAPALFRKGSGLPMSMPEDGSLDELTSFLNVDDDSMVFLLTWMVTAIINPAQQCPIAILDGSAGSAKSSTLTTIVEIVDPKVAAQAGEPRTEEDLVVAAYSLAVMSFDNVSTLAKLSDPLCRLSNGGGMAKRKQYSDGDLFTMEAMRPVMVAGLDPTFYKQDLIERIIRVSLTRPKEYMDEEVFRATRNEKMARFRGALFTLASNVLRDVHRIKQTSSRFGVFSRVGECVARIMGHDDGWFAHRYEAMRLELAVEAGAADSVYVFLTDFLRGFDEGVGSTYSATPTELFIEMKATLTEMGSLISLSDVPGNPRAISPRIVQASALLKKAHGWRVSRGNRREFVFEKVADVTASAEDVLDMFRDHQQSVAADAGM